MTKHTDCVITFQKENGDIIMRPRFSTYGLKIGDETSMGWKVLDIHYQYYDGNYYHKDDYLEKLKEKRKERIPFITRIKTKVAKRLIRLGHEWA